MKRVIWSKFIAIFIGLLACIGLTYMFVLKDTTINANEQVDIFVNDQLVNESILNFVYEYSKVNLYREGWYMIDICASTIEELIKLSKLEVREVYVNYLPCVLRRIDVQPAITYEDCAIRFATTVVTYGRPVFCSLGELMLQQVGPKHFRGLLATQKAQHVNGMIGVGIDAHNFGWIKARELEFFRLIDLNWPEDFVFSLNMNYFVMRDKLLEAYIREQGLTTHVYLDVYNKIGDVIGVWHLYLPTMFRHRDHSEFPKNYLS